MSTQGAIRTDTHTAARAYAAKLGWHVFPVAVDCRSPLIEHGCHAASTDPLQIDAWWARRPAANVALACGAKSGVFALDIDRHGDTDGFLSLMALEDEFGALPLTWRSQTPGRGEHRFFRYPAGRELRNRQKLYIQRADGSKDYFPGIDVRSNGGSVCLPPSAKPTGPYTWIDHPLTTPLAEAPAWLTELIDPPLPPAKPMPIRGRSRDRVARYVEVAVDGECDNLKGMKDGSGRNQQLFVAAANLGSLIGAALLPQQVAEAALERAAADCGLTRDDGVLSVRATIASGIRRGVQSPRELSFD